MGIAYELGRRALGSTELMPLNFSRHVMRVERFGIVVRRQKNLEKLIGSNFITCSVKRLIGTGVWWPYVEPDLLILMPGWLKWPGCRLSILL